MFPQRDGKTAGEILGDAANQKRWIEPRGVEDPGQHRGGRGLAMGAAHYDRFARAQKIFLQHLRQGTHGNTLIEHVLKFRITPRDGVPHHHQIWSRIKVRI